MAWTARLGNQLVVERDGATLPPPPTRAAATLLICLLHRQNAWVSREEIARRLYPSQSDALARAALRQTIRRMRLWLGEGALDSTVTHLKLNPNWILDLRAPGGDIPKGGQIAPGVDHEWVDEARRDWGPVETPTVDRDRYFLSAIFATAEVDPDEARMLLSGVHAFWLQLPATELRDLLRLTKPTSSDAPNLRSYYEVRGLYELGNCDFRRATKSLAKAVRCAAAEKQQVDLHRIGAYLLFCLAESGLDAEARDWTKRLGAHPHSVVFKSAVAAEEWNRGEFESALHDMRNVGVDGRKISRSNRLHFWSNMALLAAEAGELELSEAADQECSSEKLTNLDWQWRNVLQYAAAARSIGRNDPESAIRLLSSHDNRQEWPLQSLYRREWLAIAHARRGDSFDAKRHRAAVVSLLHLGGARLNRRRLRLFSQLETFA